MSCAGDLLEGRYELEAQLGAGGTARVFRARDLVTKAVVAIKLMEPGREQDPEAVAYFSQEGRLAARIRDPHLVPALHFGVDEGRHFIVYDYLPGSAPLSVLADLGRAAPRRVCEIALQVLYALDTLHRASVVHGDVSLNNCLWRERGDGRDEVRLCDLGCAWARSPSSAVTGGPTTALECRGTAYYTAPEIMNAEAGDHRADLWSVGAMMYALMTMRDVDMGDPEEPFGIPPPALLVPKIPQAISVVVMRALAPADQRYPSAVAMIEAIRAALAIPAARGGVPLWASIVGMVSAAGLAAFGSMASMADAHGDDASAATPGAAAERGGERLAQRPAAGDRRIEVMLPPPAPPDPAAKHAPADAAGAEPAPETRPAPVKSAEPVGAARAGGQSKPSMPRPSTLTLAEVERVVKREAAALRACSGDDFISLGVRVVKGRATLESLDGDPPVLPRDSCAADFVSKLRFTASDEPVAGVIGVKLP
jgi:hypothetical protein